MDLIDNITNDPNQVLGFTLGDGSVVQMTLVYRAAIARWSLDVIWNDFEALGLNVVTAPNFLEMFRLNIPFGIGCVTTDGADPVYLDDFANGRATLLMLNQADVAAVQATYLGAGVS